MKIYVKGNGIAVVGKAWQIRSVLHHYMRRYKTVHEWKNASASK